MEQGEVLDFFRTVVEDDEEDEDLRDQAVYEMLRFARPGDRGILLRWAHYAEANVQNPLFDRNDVNEAYRRKTADTGDLLKDWMDFYRPEESARRQEVWSRLEGTRRPSLEEYEALAGKPFALRKGEALLIDPRRLPPLRELIREEFRPVKVKGHEDDFAFLLFPMEQTIVQAFRRDRNLRNSDVLAALRETMDRFPDPPQGPLAAKVYEAIHMVAAANAGEVSDAEILACLNRIRDSVKFHGGTHEYLRFLEGLMP